jgi:IS30 family transposase
MLPDIQVKTLMNYLNLNEKDTIYFLARLKGWIEKNGNSTISLARGINKILSSINQKNSKKNSEELEEKKVEFGNIKSNAILKFYDEILDLEKRGFGARKIQNFLKENHHANVSHSTIFRFLNLQKNKDKK